MIKVICVVLLNISFVVAIVLILFVIFLPSKNDECEPTITTASGSAALNVCAGNLIFEENFNELDKNKWLPEVTLSDGSVSKKQMSELQGKKIT